MTEKTHTPEEVEKELAKRIGLAVARIRVDDPRVKCEISRIIDEMTHEGWMPLPALSASDIDVSVSRNEGNYSVHIEINLPEPKVKS